MVKCFIASRTHLLLDYRRRRAAFRQGTPWPTHITHRAIQLSDLTSPKLPALVELETAQWLRSQLGDQKARGSNPTSGSRLLLTRLGQPSSIPVLVPPSDGMAAMLRKGATAERALGVATSCRWSSTRGTMDDR
ncbi:hypothetical protein CSKR_100189 [Clonorchis sinensis]|uniref:Uncharacterized protein n=1 Tax=Clonorchis sinensis TaxID=79923 RepID=A0A419PPQ5_CLOSI|nr:hypothetical protein CSKR_100189 [Clonorchis sinensis]